MASFGYGSQCCLRKQTEDKVLDEVVTLARVYKVVLLPSSKNEKNQAFRAPIILVANSLLVPADMIAASALRRVTGLTLVDGKFIYVRGWRDVFLKCQIKNVRRS